MNTETMMYTVKVAILGLGVVFLSLWALSILMSLIKKAFDPERSKIAAGDKNADLSAAQESDVDGEVPPWVISGVVAYLIEEELEVSRSAEPWKSSDQARIDPWFIQGFRRRG